MCIPLIVFPLLFVLLFFIVLLEMYGPSEYKKFLTMLGRGIVLFSVFFAFITLSVYLGKLISRYGI